MNPQDTTSQTTQTSSSSVSQDSQKTSDVQLQEPVISVQAPSPDSDVQLDLSDMDFWSLLASQDAKEEEHLSPIFQQNDAQRSEDFGDQLDPNSVSTPDPVDETGYVSAESLGSLSVTSVPVDPSSNDAVSPDVLSVDQVGVSEEVLVEPSVEPSVQASAEPSVESPGDSPSVARPQDAWLAQEDALAWHSLAQDEHILKDIHGDEDLPVVSSNPVSSVVDLDALLAQPNVQEKSAVEEKSAFVFPSVPVVPAVSLAPSISCSPSGVVSSTPVLRSALTERHFSKLSVVFLVLILLLGGFVLKVMYPLQYHSILAFVGMEQKEQITGMSQDSSSLEDSLAQTGFEQTGFDESSLLVSSGVVVDEISWSHAAAPDLWFSSDVSPGFDAFKELDEGLATGKNTQETKDTLTFYVNEGKKFLLLAKKSQDKDMMKYSLVLYKKAGTLLDSLANGDQIASTGMDQQMNQFSGYLAQLNTLSYAASTSESDTTVVSQEQEKNSLTGSEQALGTGMFDVGSGDR